MRTILMLLLLSTPAFAQTTPVPFVFVTGTVANPNQVNQNFSTIYERALNRYGGQLKGSVTVDLTGAYDLGTSALRLRDAFLTGTVTAGTFIGTFTGTVGPTVTIQEIQIIDGPILARLAANETVTGAWTFTGTPLTATGAVQVGGLVTSTGGFFTTANLDVTSVRATGNISADNGSVTGNIVGGVFVAATQTLRIPAINFASLPASGTGENGWIVMCTDCAANSSPCALAPGQQALAFYAEEVFGWKCK